MNIITEKTEIRSAVVLPTAKRGRRSATDQATHAAALDRFYSAILDIQSRLKLPRDDLRQRFAADVAKRVQP